VFVNQGTSPAQITLPCDLTLANGGKPAKQFRKGDSFTVPDEDAAFFLRQ
jgi:hypothetical protein